jgi:hypothetical protein
MLTLTDRNDMTKTRRRRFIVACPSCGRRGQFTLYERQQGAGVLHIAMQPGNPEGHCYIPLRELPDVLRDRCGKVVFRR